MKPLHLVLVALVALAVPALYVGAIVVGVVIGTGTFDEKPPPKTIVRYVTREAPLATSPGASPSGRRADH